MADFTRHRLAVRGIIMKNDRLLLVNAYGQYLDKLWCAPGGGADLHSSLPDNLVREVHEETGLTVDVGDPVLINEFHDQEGDFHQVEVFFRCKVTTGELSVEWQDPADVVKVRKWFTRGEVETLALRPRALVSVAWGETDALTYDPLEPILR